MSALGALVSSRNQCIQGRQLRGGQDTSLDREDHSYHCCLLSILQQSFDRLLPHKSSLQIKDVGAVLQAEHWEWV